jgi:hypothetical protein
MKDIGTTNNAARDQARGAATRHVEHQSSAAEYANGYLKDDQQFSEYLATLSERERLAAERGWRMGFMASEFVGSSVMIGTTGDAAAERIRGMFARKEAGEKSRGRDNKLTAAHDDLLRALFDKFHGGGEKANTHGWQKAMRDGLAEKGVVVSADTLRTRLQALALIARKR